MEENNPNGEIKQIKYDTQKIALWNKLQQNYDQMYHSGKDAFEKGINKKVMKFKQDLFFKSK